MDAAALDMPLAAVLYGPADIIDDVMAQAASALQSRGLRLAGVVQHNRGSCAQDDGAMLLEDLATGAIIPISDPNMPASAGCRLDPAGLARGAASVARSLDDMPDLLVVNKFGKREAHGRGLRDEIGEALGRGIPVLTAVRDNMRDAWRDFAGEEWTALPPEPDRIVAWCLAHCPGPAQIGAQPAPLPAMTRSVARD
jgi:hypothetical protein